MLIGHHGLLSMAIGGMLLLVGIVKTVTQWNDIKQVVVHVLFDAINLFYVLYYSYYLKYYFLGQLRYSPNAGIDGLFVVTVTLEIIFFFFHLKQLLFIFILTILPFPLCLHLIIHGRILYTLLFLFYAFLLLVSS